MDYLIIFGICLLATMKMSFQSSFAKKGVRTTSDSIFFISLIFAFSSLIFLPHIIYITPQILAYAVIYAVSSVAFQLIYTRALSEGNVSIAVMFVNFAMLIPVAISCTVFGERPSVFRIIGIALTVCAFLVTVKPEGNTTKRQLFFCVLAMLANGVVSATQKFFGASEYSDRNYTFVSTAYLIAAIISVAVYAILAKSGHKRTFKMSRRPVLAALAAGVSLGLFLALNTYAVSTIDGTLLFPAHSGGTIVLSTVSGLLFFHDKLTVRQAASLALGTVAIVLMSL